METAPQRRRWSYEEFAALPDERIRYEIIFGEVYEQRAPSPKHQVHLLMLAMAMHGFLKEHGLGKVYMARVDVIMSEEHYVSPDLVFVRRDRRGIITDRAIEGVPDLAVEIVSPLTALRDRGIKRECYSECGIPLYWILDAELRHVEVYRLDADPHGPPEIVRDFLPWQPVVGGPELRIDLADVFRGFD